MLLNTNYNTRKMDAFLKYGTLGMFNIPSVDTRVQSTSLRPEIEHVSAPMFNVTVKGETKNIVVDVKTLREKKYTVEQLRQIAADINTKRGNVVIDTNLRRGALREALVEYYDNIVV